ncbi:MAG: sigma-70 family RNA polymerase sigma factor [Cytophagales bacterium]|nr:sigma-70 family RNA polymerase sigma factor [Cytophagales bacterium]
MLKNDQTISPSDENLDELLFAGIKLHDEGALETLFKKYYVTLCRKAVGIVKVDTVAEEIVSDVFFTIWSRRDKINIQSNVLGYLRYAVRNHALNYLKLRKLGTVDLSQMEYQAQTNDLDPLENLMMDECMDEWEDKISQLPMQRQKILRMCRLEGLSVAKVASQLSLAEQTVRNQVQLAIKGLK